MKLISKPNTLFLLLLSVVSIQGREYSIAMLGTGYVGLVTGTCLAHAGHQVTCVDIDQNKIDLLNQGVMTIYEPGLESLVHQTVRNGTLKFTTDIQKAISDADVIFIAVGTPSAADGTADLRAFMGCLATIAKYLSHHKIICIKSTVPIGTADKVKEYFSQLGIDKARYSLVSCPEFLREGSAVHDFFNPDRIVIGTFSEHAGITIQEIYQTCLSYEVPVVRTDHASAETIKYASNAFLASKLSFINEIANLCDQVSADIQDVSYGMGLDKRIGKTFLQCGPGFGGSCFPKDCSALIAIAKSQGVDLHMVTNALLVNELQKKRPVEKLKKLMTESLTGKTIAVLGLAFKANTDDIRYSPAIVTLEDLKGQGANIKAYDPAATQNMSKLMPDITYCSSAYEALTDADACIIMTEWPEFKQLDITAMKSLMKSAYLVDTRNILNFKQLHEAGFIFDSIGRQTLATSLSTNLEHRKMQKGLF